MSYKQSTTHSTRVVEALVAASRLAARERTPASTTNSIVTAAQVAIVRSALSSVAARAASGVSPVTALRTHTIINSSNGKKEDAYGLQAPRRGIFDYLGRHPQSYARRPPTPIDGRNKYFVELHGQRFPIK